MCPQVRENRSKRHAVGKRIAELGELLAVSPLERVDETIVAGLSGIIESVGSDRICWYELDEQSSALLHKYSATARNAPMSPKIIAPGKTPFFAEQLARHKVVAVQDVTDLPPQAERDGQFLEGLGVKSLLLIPSRYSPRKKGVLAVASYSVEENWPEESINQLTIAANMIGATLERKYAQAAVQESDERFRYLFAQAPIGIALETTEGRILEVNPAFCAMLGYSAEEILSSTCERISHPEDEEIEKPLFDELRRGVRTSYSIEKRFFRKDGSQMWGRVSVALLKHNHGGVPLVVGMVSDVTAQKSAEASLRQRDQELQRLAGHLIEAQEDERRRISYELHDDIGQRVSLLACEVDLACHDKSWPQNERDAALLPKLHRELDTVATDIHKLSHELHSSSLQLGSLGTALRDLCWKYSNNHHLEIELQAETSDASLPQEIALCLFRVAQEALANVLKHARTKKVLVKFTQDSEKIRLTVKDLGAGFDPSTRSAGIGLMSMRERLRLCGGVLVVKAALNKGTEISAEIAAVKKAAVASKG